MSGGRDVPVHYLRHNDSERTPTDIAIFDTETWWHDDALGQNHDLRVWVACHDRRGDTRRNAPGTEWDNGTDAETLARFLESRVRSAATLWVFAHNLAFDLAVTSLPDVLARNGWTVTECSVRNAAPWFRFVKGCYRIALVDSWSWIPSPLGSFSTDKGEQKPDLPGNDDDLDAWLHHCRTDVQITRDAVHTVLDFWERERCGRWSISGPACGFNAWRHKFYPGGLLIDPDLELRKFERKALYGGRREAFRVGCSPQGGFAEVDFVNAYPTIAGNNNVPLRRLFRFPGLSVDQLNELPSDRGAIANATVECDVPSLPCRIDGQVFYPTGRFNTVATSVELAHAVRSGARIEIGTGVMYQLGDLFSEWSPWVTRTHYPDGTEIPAPIRAMLKHWGRTVIGRFAARSSHLEKWSDAPSMTWGMEYGRDIDSGQDVSWLDIAGRRWLVVHDTEPDNALPAVTAWVESLCRVALSDAMRMQAYGSVVQCDTDGYLVAYIDESKEWPHGPCATPLRRAEMGLLPADLPGIPSHVGPLETRVKTTYRHVDILGPVHYWTDGQPRLSGIPKHAIETAPGEYSATLWPKLAWQLANGRGHGYLRPTVKVALTGPYGSRWVLADGRTAAPRATTVGRHTVLLPWGPDDTHRAGSVPAGRQHPMLEAAGATAVAV